MIKKLGIVMLFLAACAVSFNFTGCKPKKLGKVEVKKSDKKMEKLEDTGSSEQLE